MRKILLILTAMLLYANMLPAIPAYPGKIVFSQGNGELITIYKQGDEQCHFVVTADGYPLLFNEDSKSFEYAREVNGTLVSTGLTARDSQYRDDDEKKLLNSIIFDPHAYRNGKLKKQKKMARRKIRISDIPTTGHQKALVLLIEFSNKSFSMADPKRHYERMLNEEGYTNIYGANGSARDFYRASSDGAYDPEFVVAGPIKLSRQYSYYAGLSGTERPEEFVKEACMYAADNGLVDFSQFDTDNDGYVDNVYLFFAGYGQADSYVSYTIWPHAWNLEAAGVSLELDGKKIGRYACSQELNGQTGTPVGIGTFVHEYGHVLGLADHYDTHDSDNYTLGEWDTMCSGSYNNNQNTPPLFSAFERQLLGWLHFTPLNADEKDAKTLLPLTQENKAYRISVAEKENEYFILENRQQEGFDYFLPGHGLIAWHIDLDSTAFYDNTLNNDPSHVRVRIIPADKKSTTYDMEGDPFPGTDNVVRHFFADWAGNYAFGLNDISENDGNISFAMTGSTIEIPSPSPITVDNIMGKQATVRWHAADEAAEYEIKLYKDDNLLEEFHIDNDSAMTITTLQPESSYKVTICGKTVFFASETAETTFSTLPLQYSEKRVYVDDARDVGNGAFTARWKPLEDTEDYMINLYRHYMDGNYSETCDFSDKANSIPQGWQTDCDEYIVNLYGKEAYSLKMKDDQSYVKFGKANCTVNQLSLWCQSSYDSNTLSIDVYKDGRWQPYLESTPLKRSQPYMFKTAVDNADSVRIRANIAYYQIAVDDIEASYTCDSLHIVKKDVNAGSSLEYTFDNLEEGATYSYRVYGISGGSRSILSDTATVTISNNVAGMKTVKDDCGETEVYNMQGIAMPHSGKLPGGIYITRKGKIWCKIIIE